MKKEVTKFTIIVKALTNDNTMYKRTLITYAHDFTLCLYDNAIYLNSGYKCQLDKVLAIFLDTNNWSQSILFNNDLIYTLIGTPDEDISLEGLQNILNDLNR